MGPLVLGTFALRILSQAFLFAVAAISVDLLWGYTGVLTFGQSAFFGIGVYGVGLVLAHYASGLVGIVAASLGAMVVAAAIGALVAWLAFWDGASPIYPGVVTLALPIVFTQIILSGGSFTGSSSGLPIPVPPLSFEHWYWLSGGVVLIVATATYVLVTSDAGRILLAIRENEERCRYLGLRPSRWKIGLMTACSALAALAGAFYVLFASVAAPQYGDFLFGTELVVWTALGGRGTLAGPILGTIGINYVSAILGGNLPFVWLLVIGTVFVVVVVYLPHGLVPPLLQKVGMVGRRFRHRSDWRTERPGTGETAVVRAIASPGPAVGTGTGPGGIGLRADRPPALELRDVTKWYGSLPVLRGVTLTVRKGEVVSIVGPNGAGKTTLLRCISDGRERSSGTILINGHRTDGVPPQECVALGLGRKFQTPNVFEALSVLDCLRIARSYRVAPSVWRRSPTVELPSVAMRVVEATGLLSVLDRPAGHLPHGMKQALELAMVLALEPNVLLLDEPTAGLTGDERAAIGAVLTELAQDHQLCVVLIEHDVDFVRTISTRLVVLHMGRIVLDGSPAEVAESDVVRDIYIGGGSRG
ncbi:MAG: ATP-binding cassette domain-containing protein [Armatimonadota bacterium]|nr:ATP-binding cassette domain-containing protein [Armatimonadota bacterium]